MYLPEIDGVRWTERDDHWVGTPTREFDQLWHVNFQRMRWIGMNQWQPPTNDGASICTYKPAVYDAEVKRSLDIVRHELERSNALFAATDAEKVGVIGPAWEALTGDHIRRHYADSKRRLDDLGVDIDARESGIAKAAATEMLDRCGKSTHRRARVMTHRRARVIELLAKEPLAYSESVKLAKLVAATEKKIEKKALSSAAAVL